MFYRWGNRGSPAAHGGLTQEQVAVYGKNYGLCRVDGSQLPIPHPLVLLSMGRVMGTEGMKLSLQKGGEGRVRC